MSSNGQSFRFITPNGFVILNVTDAGISGRFVPSIQTNQDDESDSRSSPISDSFSIDADSEQLNCTNISRYPPK